MKKILVISLILFYCLSYGQSANGQVDSKKSAMSAFFKIEWGVSAGEFKTKFKELLPKEKLIRAETGFDCYLFMLGDVQLVQLKFLFRTKEGKEVRIKKNLDKTFFYKVLFDFEPKDFPQVVEMFKLKYGEPTKVETSELQNRFGAKFEQQVLIWINAQLKRSIILKKYTDVITQSIAILAPLEMGKEKDPVKAGADTL